MKTLLYPALFISLTILLQGCEAIGDIFSAGIWVGVIAVVLVIVLIAFIAGKAKK